MHLPNIGEWESPANLSCCSKIGQLRFPVSAYWLFWGFPVLKANRHCSVVSSDTDSNTIAGLVPFGELSLPACIFRVGDYLPNTVNIVHGFDFAVWLYCLYVRDIKEQLLLFLSSSEKYFDNNCFKTTVHAVPFCVKWRIEGYW